jgi:hypothetical protein
MKILKTKEAKLTKRMLMIDEFCRENKLNKDFRLRLKHASRFVLDRNGVTPDDLQAILVDLPKQLRYLM